MRERSAEQKEKYKRVRSEFDDLEIEDKALFLLEATVGTVARGVEQFGKGFAEEIDKAFRQAKRERDEWAAEKAAEEGGTTTGTGEASRSTGSNAGATGPTGTTGSTSDFSGEKKSSRPPTAADDGDEPII